MHQLHTHPLPATVDPADLAGSTVIVVDLLRASTTICHALHAGATCIIPFLEVVDTNDAVKSYDRCQLVLGGERNGLIIPRFDLGNSPAEYTADQVDGRIVLFTTTNGTRALHHASQAKEVLIGAAVNALAVATAASAAPGRIDILCAGTDGQVTEEDLLAAGALAHRIYQIRPKCEWKSDAATTSAHHVWEELVKAARIQGCNESDQLAHRLIATQGGRNLIDIGKADDLPRCAQLDTLAVVPAWNRQTGQIRLR